MTIVPSFENPHLSEIATAFRKRRRALTHKLASAELIKVFEDRKAGRSEGLEITLKKRVPGRGPILVFRLWVDRWVWIDARLAEKKGWTWEWTVDGRLAGTAHAKQIIEILEETSDRLFDMDSTRTDELSALWSAILAKGPIAVR
jgi:hypothetical protein